MRELNQYAIGKALGTTMQPIKSVGFGNFALLETTAEALRSHRLVVSGRQTMEINDDRLIVRAFEDVREGAAPDAILWDRELAQRFDRRCRELGLNAASSVFNRRLLNIRKNSRRYEELGIVISPTTKAESHASIVPEYAHVIEFALVHLRYRFGASIDDILLDPELANIFEQLARQIAPRLRSQDLRLGALYIRKTRHVSKAEVSVIHSMDTRALEAELSNPVALSDFSGRGVPQSPGLIEVKEQDRYLYIARNENLKSALERLAMGRVFEIVSNAFWSPRLDEITIQFVAGASVAGFTTARWERRLIQDRAPIFNWPMHRCAA